MEKPIKILVVDDEEAARRNFRSCLEDMGYDVTLAADGREAVDTFPREPVDMVLTDLRMPSMDGLELIARLKEINSDVPVVVVSGTGNLQNAIEAIRQGAWDYVVKPVQQPGELDICIKRTLERARLTVENRQHREHLEELVKKRTQELQTTQEQLHQAQKMEAVGQLAGGVAHDFNNLLTVILGNVELISSLLPDEPSGQKAIRTIQDATEQAIGVTRSLLTFSRRLPVEKKMTRLQDVLQSVARMLHRLMPATIQIIIDDSPEPPLWVEADPIQLQQVLMNLAINARDAMPNGGTLTISIQAIPEMPTGMDTNVSAGHLFACLIVSDTGTGIPEEIRPRLFEPFFSTKPRGQGTGLGLSIVHGIVQNHNGRIVVESTVGQGTTFRIFLPCIQPGTAGSAPVSAITIPRGQGELILLAEDNAFVRSTIMSVLLGLGYDVAEAADGLSLIEQWQTQGDRTRLVILDTDMPGYTGLQCLQAIREQNALMPAIVITGSLDRSHGHGFNGHTVMLRKPFGMKQLGILASRLINGDGVKEGEL